MMFGRILHESRSKYLPEVQYLLILQAMDFIDNLLDQTSIFPLQKNGVWWWPDGIWKLSLALYITGLNAACGYNRDRGWRCGCVYWFKLGASGKNRVRHYARSKKSVLVFCSALFVIPRGVCDEASTRPPATFYSAIPKMIDARQLVQRQI